MFTVKELSFVGSTRGKLTEVLLSDEGADEEKTLWKYIWKALEFGCVCLNFTCCKTSIKPMKPRSEVQRGPES